MSELTEAERVRAGRDARLASVTEWRNAREYGEEGSTFSNGARKMALHVRAELRPLLDLLTEVEAERDEFAARWARDEALAGAKALEDAAAHFDRYDEVTIGETDIGSNQIPVEPAERLRSMAAALRSDAHTEQKGEGEVADEDWDRNPLQDGRGM